MSRRKIVFLRGCLFALMAVNVIGFLSPFLRRGKIITVDAGTISTLCGTGLRAILQSGSDAGLLEPSAKKEPFYEWMKFRTPTDAEVTGIDVIKKLLIESEIDYPLTDITLLRFLRSRKQDVDEAVKELITHVSWRKEHQVDTIRTDTTSYTSEYNKRKCINEGYDRMGRPLVSMIARRHDKNNRDISEVCNLIIHTLETATHRSRSRQNDEKIVILFDMSGFSTSVMDYEAVKVLINILLKNYPDILAASFIVNSPLLFSACWAIIRPWLDPVTAAKCVFLKPHQLVDYVDVAELPADIAGVTAKK